MKVTAGAWGVHASFSYDFAEMLEAVIDLIEMDSTGELGKFKDLLTTKVEKGRAKGYPLRPLPNTSWPVIVEPGDPQRPAASMWELMTVLGWAGEQCRNRGLHDVADRIDAVLKVDLDPQSEAGESNGRAAKQGGSGDRSTPSSSLEGGSGE